MRRKQLQATTRSSPRASATGCRMVRRTSPARRMWACGEGSGLGWMEEPRAEILVAGGHGTAANHHRPPLQRTADDARRGPQISAVSAGPGCPNAWPARLFPVAGGGLDVPHQQGAMTKAKGHRRRPTPPSSTHKPPPSTTAFTNCPPRARAARCDRVASVLGHLFCGSGKLVESWAWSPRAGTRGREQPRREMPGEPSRKGHILRRERGRAVPVRRRTAPAHPLTEPIGPPRIANQARLPDSQHRSPPGVLDRNPRIGGRSRKVAVGRAGQREKAARALHGVGSAWKRAEISRPR